ncbi:MTOR-associated protein MEAK7 [Calypte anna]|uniref:MTOR-associated protein MEAK7 n=1 Tax=Calypte anna TaxID=9244 RepID=UPI0004C1B2C3|nr:MTOR-associated protein MEAK7 [Calypte anna]XP_030313891.1 MTOR-associated protein MEAK7 [Calypte anna]XP_030313892.1 MTOR-associated protein MEAK7 [Calypte anna]
MGNAESSVYQNHLSRFLPEEQSDIDGLFDTLSGSSGSSGTKNGKATKKTVTLAALQAFTREPLPQQMCLRLYNGMRSIDLPGKPSGLCEQIVKEQFVIFMSNLLKGNADEKITIIMRMISKTKGPVKGKQIQEFTEDLITSVVHVLNYRKELKGWSLENTRDSTSGVKALATQLLSELKFADGTKPVGPQLMETDFDQSVIQDWVYRVPQISVFLSVVVRQGLHVLHSLLDQTKDTVNLVPGCKGIKGRGLASLFDLPSIMYINSHLPAELQHKWHLLFSSRFHGESFSQLCAHVVNRGPCLVILKDSDGYIFGGFASHSWEVKPQFQGDNRCFLFSIFPSLAVYTYTGYNDHYMYLNHGQQTMPNGLGMGGQHEYFGLWIDSDYGKGHSKAKPRCTTYNSPQLSAKEEFTLDAMEVWAVGDLPERVGTKGKKSILDVDPEAQALLEMTGKCRQSEGLREPAGEDEDDENY